MTGGAGYLGSILVPRLLQAGHAVLVMDTFRYGQTPLLDWCGHSGLEILRADVRDKSAVKAALRQVDAVIPLAAIVGAPACDRDRVAAGTTNVEAIDLLLGLRSGDQSVIYPNTNSGYGTTPEGDMASEETPCRPLSLYAKLKTVAEDHVLQRSNTVSLRLATLFGASPRMRRDLLVNDFVWRAVTDGWLMLYEGRFRRCFSHVLDAAGAFHFALEQPLTHRVYNVGLPAANMSKRELCEAIQRVVQTFHWIESDHARDPDQRDYLVDCSRLLAEGWRPERTLDDGIGELLQAYRILPRGPYANV